jgi:hypothetical protein
VDDEDDRLGWVVAVVLVAVILVLTGVALMAVLPR